MKSISILFLFAFSSVLSATTYYVAPTGGSNSNPGTMSRPWATISYSINNLTPGDTLVLRGGIYYLTSQLRFDSVRDGTSVNPIVMINYPGENPIIDCDGLTAQSGIVINNVHHWVIQGIEQRNARQDGSTIACTGFAVTSCTNLHLNYIKVHDNGGYGMDLRMCDELYIRGVDTYNNCDSLNSNPAYNGGKGDGNGCMNYSTGSDTLTWGKYYFDKCRSWHNSDDGFGIGYQAYVYLDSCWSWGNGSPLYAQGAGRGFSTGHGLQPSPSLPHIILTNCIAAYNKGNGFYHNCNGEPYTTTQAWYNCVSAFNGGYGFHGLTPNANPPDKYIYWRNNISYGNGNDNFSHEGLTSAPSYLIRDHNSWDAKVTLTKEDFISIDTTGISAPRKADGSFPDNQCYNYFMRPARGSDLINAGVNVGLPFDGDAPDIGAFEYISDNPDTPSNPILNSSAIENTTPARLDMTFNLTLANIVPAASAFTVIVNSSQRAVNSVSISGTRVSLTLASPVIYGDIVTVSYSKPAINPVQTSAGGQAASFSVYSVRNNVAAISPVMNSAAIENTTPARLDMTFSLTLANIVPAASAFTVIVNSSQRAVNSVSVSGTRVSLTLTSPVIYGDIVTVAYTKPASNPVQTSAGGQAASFSAYSVRNNVAVVSPVLNSAAIENTTPARLDMTFSLTLANIVPAASAFSVMVNSSQRAVNSVAVSGTRVSLTLANPVVYGDIITVTYAKPATNPIQTTAGGQAASLSAYSVKNNVAAAIPVYVSSVVENATPTRLDMTYSLNLANIVPATSAFSVIVNSAARSVSSVTISGTKVLLTISSPVVYGDVVTVAYTKPATNPLQTTAGGQVTSMSAQSVVNNCTVPDNQPPVVSLSSPTKSSSYIAPATITIDATASDPDGSISKVEFYQGTVKIGERTSLPYSFTWKEVPEGNYLITAVATDNYNLKATSIAVSVVVEKSADATNMLPVVTITTPNKGKKYKKNDKVNIEAVATDPDGSITKVEFKSGSVILAELTSSPYVYTWDASEVGNSVITVIATDNLGATSSENLDLFVGPLVEMNSDNINIYPNPNDGHFKIEINPEISESDYSIKIVNLAGKTIYHQKMTGQESSGEFDLSYSPAGAYIVMVTSDNSIQTTKKFIKR